MNWNLCLHFLVKSLLICILGVQAPPPPPERGYKADGFVGVATATMELGGFILIKIILVLKK
jgi:hypothetical protein